VKPCAQITRRAVDPCLRFRIRKEREEIPGWAATFWRPERSPTVKVENKLHIPQ
jgi:hypothetical protein